VPVSVGRTDKEEKFEKYERRRMRRKDGKFENYERRRKRRCKCPITYLAENVSWHI
jgi:hypothetical protein